MEGQAIDYGDKSITKSQSVAYREFLYKTFVVPLEQSEDIENQSHELKKPTEVLPVEKPFFGKPQFEQLSNEIKQGIVNEENVDGIKKKIFANYTIAPEWISSLKNLFDGGVMKVSKEVVETAEIPEKTKLEEVLEQVEAIKEKKVLTAEEVENLDF